VGAAANPDDADPAKPEDADPANPESADPVKPDDPVKPGDADPVKPEDPAKPVEADPAKVGGADPAKVGEADPVEAGGADPAKVGEADPVNAGGADPAKVGEADPVNAGGPDPAKVGEPDPGIAGLSGAGMNPVGWSSGAASASGAWLPVAAEARGPAGAPFFPAPFLPVPFLAVPGLRAGTWVAARTSASRADRACRRRHALTAKMDPNRSRKTMPAMAASMTSLLLMFRWIGLLCTAGGEGGDGAAA